MKPIAWYDPSNGMVSTDQHCPLFTPLGQVWSLVPEGDIQREIENLKSVMVAAAEEISKHWDAHCDEEGYGPVNLLRRLEAGIPAEYGYKAGDFHRLSSREWVGLSDEEIQQGYETTGHYQTLRPQDRFAVFALARAIEAKLMEKNQ